MGHEGSIGIIYHSRFITVPFEKRCKLIAWGSFAVVLTPYFTHKVKDHLNQLWLMMPFRDINWCQCWLKAWLGLLPDGSRSLSQQIFTLNVRGPSYIGLTKSISLLPMPWLLTSPGHQQPWYWLYRICRSFSYLRKYLCQINVEKWHKMQIYVNVPLWKI